MFLSFRGYLGEIESEKDKLRIFRILFFSVNVQCCVRVSAAKFQVLTRNSGGARAFGNIVRLMAGPASTNDMSCSTLDPLLYVDQLPLKSARAQGMETVGGDCLDDLLRK